VLYFSLICRVLYTLFSFALSFFLRRLSGGSIEEIYTVYSDSILRTVHQTELDLAKVGHDIPNHQKPVVLHVDLDVVAEICAFCKQYKMRKTLRTTHNLLSAILRDTEISL